MPRPTVAVERRAQIIDATQRTMAAHGVSGTTLDRIAEAAGMSRGHVRHFVGNRDRLLAETAREVFTDEDGTPTILPRGTRTLDDALDFLFGAELTTSDAENAVVLGLVEVSRSQPEIASILSEAYRGTRATLATLLQTARPATAPEVCAVIADGVLATALGNVFLGDFDPDPARTARARQAADRLISAV